MVYVASEVAEPFRAYGLARWPYEYYESIPGPQQSSRLFMGVGMGK